jgi:two-component system, NarL family, nitrate/nitrite response regulator NarL
MGQDGWAGFERLSRKERDVLSALMRGETAQQISHECYVSLPTVRSQIRSILVKLGVSSQLAAVVLAYRSGWPGELEVPAGGPDRLAVGM